MRARYVCDEEAGSRGDAVRNLESVYRMRLCRRRLFCGLKVGGRTCSNREGYVQNEVQIRRGLVVLVV